MRIVLACGVILGLAFGAQAQTGGGTLRQPDDIEIYNRWPLAARNADEARVLLACEVAANDRLIGCQITSETPPALGFGDLAVRYAADFRLKVPASPGTIVRLPFYFRRTFSIPRKVDVSVTNPAWIRTPSWAQTQAAFPEQAKADMGQVLMRCSLTPEGRPTVCKALSERPRGQGFGAAAVSVASHFETRFNDHAESVRSVTATFPVQLTRPVDIDPRRLVSPAWTRRVSIEEAMSLYPAAARAAGVTQGEVSMRCTVLGDGGLSACSALAETPEGLGFADAAVRLVATMRVNPWATDGYPLEGVTFDFPVRFSVP